MDRKLPIGLFRKVLLAALVVGTMGACLQPTAEAADDEGADWPHWRGPNHNGISPETGWVKDWPDDGPRIAWRAEIGLGFGSFAATEDRVWVMGNKGGRETVYCFDAESGDVIWEHGYEASLINKLHEGGPSSTPTLHDGKVYTLGKEGHVFCLDAEDGEVIWRADMKKVAGLEKPPHWGFASSAVIHDGKVIFQAGRTVAFDPETGDVVWKSKRYKPGYSTPAPITLDGEPAVASLNSYGLSVQWADDGKEYSHFPWEAKYDTNAATPIVEDRKVFLTAGYKKGCGLVELKKGEAELVYRKKQPGDSMSNHMNTSVLYDGHLYGFDGNTGRNKLVEVVCMDFYTGREKWRHRGLGVGSLIISDGHLILLSDSGELVIAEATPEGFNPVSRSKVLSGKCWTSPVLAHGRIYARNAEGDVVCVDVRPKD